MKTIYIGAKEIVELKDAKDPESEQPYIVDWGWYLRPRGDTIDTVETTADNVTVADITNDDYEATIRVSGGADGDLATIKQKIVTAGGYPYVRRFRLRVKER